MSASAQQYPSQDIHLICGYPAGSGADIIVRYYGEKLRAATGRTVLVENKPGAQGNIATEYLARAKPDGYTIYLNGGSVLAANMHVFKNPPVDVVKQLQVVAGINKLATMLSVVRNFSTSSWKNLAELTAYLKQKGDKASYGISNPVAQVAGAIYKEKTGVQAGAGRLQIRLRISLQRSARAARSTTRCTIRSTRWRSSAKAGVRVLAISHRRSASILTRSWRRSPSRACCMLTSLGWWAAVRSCRDAAPGDRPARVACSMQIQEKLPETNDVPQYLRQRCLGF